MTETACGDELIKTTGVVSPHAREARDVALCARSGAASMDGIGDVLVQWLQRKTPWATNADDHNF